MKVAFRVDVSVDMGVGHLMRCVTLANALRQIGAQIIFISDDRLGIVTRHVPEIDYHQLEITDPKGVNKKEEGSLYSDWLRLGWHEDAKQTKQFLADWQADWLVVDHYAIDRRWHRVQKQVVHRILVIDDLADRKHECHLLLDQTFGRKSDAYIGLVPKDCKLLLGSQYALLRPEFFNLRDKSLQKRKHQTEINNVLIFMGGTDSKNLTEVALNAIEKIPWPVKKPSVSIVLSSKAPYLERIQEISDQSSCAVTIYVDCRNMAKLMLDADVAIGAGGTASWERCALGLPAFVIAFVANQKQVVDMLEVVGAVKQWERSVGLVDLLLDLSTSPNLLQDMASKASSITDATGTCYLVNQMRMGIDV